MKTMGIEWCPPDFSLTLGRLELLHQEDVVCLRGVVSSSCKDSQEHKQDLEQVCRKPSPAYPHWQPSVHDSQKWMPFLGINAL